jgi:hypothetical protein
MRTLRLLPATLGLFLIACPEPPTAPVGGPGGNPPPGGEAGGPGGAPGTPPGGEGGSPPPNGGNVPPAGGGNVMPTIVVEEGKGVDLGGNLTWTGTGGVIRIDILADDGKGGQLVLHAANIEKAGKWTIPVNQDQGEITIMGFVDYDGNGPSPNEPAVTHAKVAVGKTPITTLDFDLDAAAAALPGGGAPGGAPAAGATPPADGAAPPADGAAPPADGAAPPADGAAPPADGAAPPADAAGKAGKGKGKSG